MFFISYISKVIELESYQLFIIVSILSHVLSQVVADENITSGNSFYYFIKFDPRLELSILIALEMVLASSISG
jgi:hypothetical protein